MVVFDMEGDEFGRDDVEGYRRLDSVETDVSVIILTYNEEVNIAHALASVCDWARQIIVLDSFSTDRTEEIVRSYRTEFFQHTFVNYADQRNHALTKLPIWTEWVLFLDADERLTNELKLEITYILRTVQKKNGFFLKRKLIWMGRWVKRGYYPCWILRLFRHREARCEDRAVNEHLVIEGEVGYLEHDLVHEDHKGLTSWIAKHNNYATLEARELFLHPRQKELDATFFGTPPQRKRWMRHFVWNRLPPLIRPFIFFLYRYLFRAGFLDGRAGFTYHFLQGLWFPFLIDMKYLELKSDSDRQRYTANNDQPG